MWKCNSCQESVEDSYDVCWNCGTSKDGVPDPTFRRVENARDMESGRPGRGNSTSPTTRSPAAVVDPIACPRCDEELEHLGTKRFHEGANWGILGELGEMFVKRERFDIYVCPRCGRVEFFVDGLGEQYRPQ